MGRGCPPPHREWGLGRGQGARGAVPPPPKFFLDFSSKNGAFWRVLGWFINTIIGLAHDSGFESEPPPVTV